MSQKNNLILHYLLLNVLIITLQLNASVLDSIKSMRIQVWWYSSEEFGSDDIKSEFSTTCSSKSTKIESPKLKSILKRASVQKIDSSELIGGCLDGNENDAFIEVVTFQNDTLLLQFTCYSYTGKCIMRDNGFLIFDDPFSRRNYSNNVNWYYVFFDKNDQIELFNLFYAIRVKTLGLDRKYIPEQEFYLGENK